MWYTFTFHLVTRLGFVSNCIIHGQCNIRTTARQPRRQLTRRHELILLYIFLTTVFPLPDDETHTHKCRAIATYNEYINMTGFTANDDCTVTIVADFFDLTQHAEASYDTFING